MNQAAPSGRVAWSGATATLAQGPRPLVLVVDDQTANIKILNEILQDDCEVCVATSGQAALEFCDRRPPDLILLDVMMPGIDGYQVCRHLKNGELTQEVPVIFVTAHNDPGEEARGLDLGAVDFISKPFHARVVRARVRTQLTLKLQAEALRRLALIDGLTGVANRRHFDTTLAAEWRRCTRTRSSLALILADIDFFKRYNDHYGHQAGDDCIKAIAAVLKSALLRSHDLVARYGGEEFVCILPDTPADGAWRKAVELEAAVRALAMAHEKSEAAAIVTVSIGVAVATPVKGDDPTRLVAEADRQLYAAKQAGRARIRLAMVRPEAPGDMQRSKN